jgi:hypothetical protein
MSPEEIDAAVAFLRTCAGLVQEIHFGTGGDPVDRDRRAILEVWLESAAGRLEIDKGFLEQLPDRPLETLRDLGETLRERLAKLSEDQS